jgi:hypothetical protein
MVELATMLGRVPRLAHVFGPFGLVCPTLVMAGTIACRGGEQGGKTRANQVLQRGDVVVVERTAAEFFEGRVLSITATSLKVQTSEDGEPVLVALSDAYRVMDAQREATPGAPAICNDHPQHWAACRVTAKNGPLIVAMLSTGSDASLPTERVMRPSAVTALNIKKTFESNESRRRFDEAAVGAGNPQRPQGWIPEVREPVIARRGPNWFTAHVAGMLEDGGVLVLFEGSDRPEAVSGNSVVPMPPYTRNFTKGDFALARPKSATEPWQRMRVEAVGPEEAIVVSDDGERQRFEARQLVPVVPRP